MKSCDISVVIPSYLEAENLKIILPNLIQVLREIQVNYQILVIDSVDNLDETNKICQEFSVEHINRENGNSYGDAVRTGIKYASGDCIVFMDGDCQQDPNDIKILFNKYKENYDLVIASRYVENGITDVNRFSAICSLIVNSLYSFIFGIKIKDISTSYKLYNLAQLKQLNLKANNFDIIEEILIKLFMKYRNIKVIEISSHFQKRFYGKTKRKLILFIWSYFSTLVRLLISKVVPQKNLYVERNNEE